MTQCQLIDELDREQLKAEIPEFRVGDDLKVTVKIIEGNKERLQAFTGIVIARKGAGLSESISLYRVAYGSAMERVFILHSPRLVSIEVTRRGKVRRSKLYDLRGKQGKAAKVKERIVSMKKKKAKPAVKKEEPAPVKEDNE